MKRFAYFLAVCVVGYPAVFFLFYVGSIFFHGFIKFLTISDFISEPVFFSIAQTTIYIADFIILKRPSLPIPRLNSAHQLILKSILLTPIFLLSIVVGAFFYLCAALLFSPANPVAYLSLFLNNSGWHVPAFTAVILAWDYSNRPASNKNISPPEAKA